MVEAVVYLLPQPFAEGEYFWWDYEMDGGWDWGGRVNTPFEPLAFFVAIINVASDVNCSTYFSCASGVSDVA